MRNVTPHPSQVRAEAEALLRQGTMTQLAIARQVGVPRGTVAHWHCELGRSAARRPIRAGEPQRWTPLQREALRRLLRVPGCDPRDLGQALGLPRRAARNALARAGLPVRPIRRKAGITQAGPPPEPAALAAALRGHVARQIAAFDVRLAGREPDLDSARVLRDLAGLRRLIDDLRGPMPPSTTDGDSDAGIPDLAERRARLVGRLAALEPGELAARLSRRA